MKTPDFVSVNDVVASYLTFLSRNARYNAHRKKFEQRQHSHPDSATAEAIVFSILQSSKADPDLLEDPKTGGSDFVCHPGGSCEFVVEVKSLEPEGSIRRSHWPIRPDGSVGGAYQLDTSKLKGAAVSADGQLAAYRCPRVAAIASLHDSAVALMNRGAAKDLLPAVTPCLRYTSAIWLVGVFGDQSWIVGVLHPDPEIAFDPGCFSLLPSDSERAIFPHSLVS